MPSMTEAVPLPWVLTLAGALFCVGLFGALSRRNTVGILLGIELMLNAVNINLVAFWRYLEPNVVAGADVRAVHYYRCSGRSRDRSGDDHCDLPRTSNGQRR